MANVSDWLVSASCAVSFPTNLPTGAFSSSVNEAAPITGGLIFELRAIAGAPLVHPRGARHPGVKGTPKRRLARAKIAKARAARKEKRKQ